MPHFWYDVGIRMNDRCIENILTRYYIPICIYDSMHTYTNHIHILYQYSLAVSEKNEHLFFLTHIFFPTPIITLTFPFFRDAQVCLRYETATAPPVLLLVTLTDASGAMLGLAVVNLCRDAVQAGGQPTWCVEGFVFEVDFFPEI